MDSTVLTWLVSGIAVLLNLAVTTTLTILIKRWFEHKDKRDEARETERQRLAQLEEERKQAEMQRMMDARCDMQVSAIRTEMAPIMEKLGKIENGTLSGLRDDILTCYYRCLEKGYRNDWDYTNIHDLHEAYERLGGNSFIADVMNRFDNLPTREEWLAKKGE